MRLTQPSITAHLLSPLSAAVVTSIGPSTTDARAAVHPLASSPTQAILLAKQTRLCNMATGRGPPRDHDCLSSRRLPLPLPSHLISAPYFPRLLPVSQSVRVFGSTTHGGSDFDCDSEHLQTKRLPNPDGYAQSLPLAEEEKEKTCSVASSLAADKQQSPTDAWIGDCEIIETFCPLQSSAGQDHACTPRRANCQWLRRREAQRKAIPPTYARPVPTVTSHNGTASLWTWNLSRVPL